MELKLSNPFMTDNHNHVSETEIIKTKPQNIKCPQIIMEYDELNKLYKSYPCFIIGCNIFDESNLSF